MKNIALVIVASLAMAESVKAQSSPVEKILLFGMGYLSGHVAHELGHITTSDAFNVPMHIVTDWNQFPPVYELVSPFARRRNIEVEAEGGFMAEIVSSEIILATTNNLSWGNDYDCYLLGWLTMTIADPILYTIRDQMTPGGWGDLQVIQEVGGNKRAVEAMVIAHSILTFARVMLKLGDGRTVQISSTPMSVNICINF